MESTARPTKIIRFGPFEADLAAERLLRNGLPVRLQDQPLRLLLLLLEHPGEIVSREEMRSRLWPMDSYGDFDNGLNVAVRKVRAALGDETDKPKYIETVPRRGYRFVAEVTEASASESSQGDLPELLPARSVAFQPPEPSSIEIGRGPARGRLLNRRNVLAVIGFAILIALAVVVPRWRQRPIQPDLSVGAGAGASRRSVAVLGFRNSSGRPEDAWLSTALSEMFSTELAAGDHLRLISGEDVVHMRLTQPKLDVDSLSSSTARQLKRALGTDLIVSGSYAAVDSGDSRLVRLDVRLQDANSGEILTELSGNGKEKALFQLVGEVGEQLRQKLGVSGISAAEHSQVLASMPSTREAGELYSNGLVKLRAYDAMSAKDILEQSIAADPSFPLSHSALADAWGRLGYDQHAIQEAQKAYDLSTALLPTERLQVQARFLEVKGEWEKAAEAYRTLHNSFPDDPQFTVLLARCLTRAGKGKDALALLGLPRKLNASGQASDSGEDNAQIELAAADAAEAVGDMERASRASEAAVTTARAQGQTLVVAQALRTEGLVLENLKQFDKAMAVTEEARRIYENAGDRFGVASVLEVQANVFSDQGNLTGALDKYQQELSIANSVGNKRGQASALNNIATVLNQQGDLERSRAMWEQAQLAFRQLGDKSNTSVVLVNIGGVFKDQGDIATARSRYEQALTLSKEMNDASDIVLALNALATALDAQGEFAEARRLLLQSSEIDRANGQGGASSENLVDLGDVLQHQGDLTAARKAYEEALTTSQASGEKSLSGYGFFGLGRIGLLNADFAAADRNYRQALQLRQDLGEVFTVAESEMALAEVALEEGRAADSEPVLRKVREVFRKVRRQDDVVNATALLARSLLMESKNAEASREADALPPLGQIQNIDIRIAALLAKGEVERKMGKLSDAQATIQSASKEANVKGYRAHIFEARLALLECKPASTQRNREVDKLSRDAREAGFNFLVDKAHIEGASRATIP